MRFWTDSNSVCSLFKAASCGKCYLSVLKILHHLTIIYVQLCISLFPFSLSKAKDYFWSRIYFCLIVNWLIIQLVHCAKIVSEHKCRLLNQSLLENFKHVRTSEHARTMNVGSVCVPVQYSTQTLVGSAIFMQVRSALSGPAPFSACLCQAVTSHLKHREPKQKC